MSERQRFLRPFLSYVAYLEPGVGQTPVRLETIGPGVTYGKVDVNSSPGGVKVELNGEYSGATNTFGDHLVSGLLPGTYTLKLTKDGYGEWSKQLTVGAGQTQEVTAFLEPLG